MPITYNADNDIITITGFTEDNPCTFEDIYQADQSNGWGKVEKKESTYHIHCPIEIGNSENDAWLIDKNQSIFFYGGYAFKNSTNTGHLILGEVEDEENKITKNGCYIECYGSYFCYYIKNINLFDTMIKSKYTGNCSAFGVSGLEGKIWNCKLYKIMLQGFASELDMDDVELGYFDEGSNMAPFAAFDMGNGNMNNIKVYNSDYAVMHYYFAAFNIKDLSVKNIRTALIRLMNSSYPSYAIDWNVNWSQNIMSGFSHPMGVQIYRQYSVNFKIQDENKNPVSNAKVILKDKNGNIVYSEISDESGKTPINIIDWGYYAYNNSNNTTISYPSTPHTLIITKHGYIKYETKITIDKKLENYIVTIRKENINIDQEVLS